MLLAELEVRHTRSVVPTRRIALGDIWLPTDPAPGHGGLLLAAVIGSVVAHLDDEMRDELDRLIDDLAHHRRIPQPRLRYRFQTDTVGLDRSRHKLHRAASGGFIFELDDHGNLLPQALGAVYAAGKVSFRHRAAVFRIVRRATRWEGGSGEALLHYLLDDAVAARRWAGRDEAWALTVLGFRSNAEPARSEILGRFRTLVRTAHPDHGGVESGAGERISDLTEAKRILLASG